MGRAIGTNEYDNPVGANHPFRRLDGHVRVLDVNRRNQTERYRTTASASSIIDCFSFESIQRF
jgi:hypothetical protein